MKPLPLLPHGAIGDPDHHHFIHCGHVCVPVPSVREAEGDTEEEPGRRTTAGGPHRLLH